MALPLEQGLETIPEWLERDPRTHPNPPTETRLQELPFGDLAWDNFERLCLRLARTSSDVENCRLYGTPGQGQEGIDLYARKHATQKYVVYQCKRVIDFGPKKIETAVEEFLNGTWVDRADEFVLCTKADLRKTQRSEEIEKQRAVLSSKGITLIVWDASELNIRLKDHARIVDDFFGRGWVGAYCNPAVASDVQNRTDGPTATTVRAALRKLYSITFKADDPGLPASVHNQTYLPLESRYVVPDVLSSRTTFAEPSPVEQKGEVKSDGASIGSASQNSHQNRDRRSQYRQPVNEWLKDKRHSVILAGPGMGKSTLLRFLALDLLSESPRFPMVASVHANRLPVWIPFGYWTALIAGAGTRTPSIEDVVERWLHHLAYDELWPSVSLAMKDERLLLLIDGLDEYRSEAAADLAVKQLHVFVESRNAPAIATSRPQGFQRLPAFPMEWERATLAELNREQRKSFLSNWIGFRISDHDQTVASDTLSIRVTTEADHLEQELQQTSGLRELSGTPLLLGIVVYLKASNLPLPQNRFQAYRRIVDHLISDHPRLRQRAASLADAHPQFTVDDLRRILAALAFYISTTTPEGGIDRANAVSAIAAFLSDPELGFGYETPKAKQLSEIVISQSELSLGLLVERAPGSCAFLHRAFHEHLSATHLASINAKEQLLKVSTHAADQQWREIILGMTYLSLRPLEVREIVTRLDEFKGDSLSRFSVDAILCEIASGPFQCPPDLSIALCRRFIENVETGPWIPHRIDLLRLLLGGLKSPKVGAVVKERLHTWYPARSAWRRDLYNVLSQQRLDDTVVEALFRSLHDEHEYNQEHVANIIGSLASQRPELADRLVALLSRPQSFTVVAAISVALLEGWPEHPIWDQIELVLRQSHSSDLRLIAIRRRIKTSRHDELDRKEVLSALSQENNFNFRFAGNLVSALVTGWPSDNEIRDQAIRDIDHRVLHEGGFNAGVAAQILLAGFSTDPAATDALCHLIANVERSFLGGGHGIWYQISQKYAGNQQMIAAADEWLNRWSAHQYSEISFASRLGFTPTAKTKLLESLGSGLPFWSAEVLIEQWGLDDEEVASGFNALMASNEAAEVGRLFPRIVRDRNTCFEKLIAFLEADKCRNPGSVLSGLCEVMEPTERERVLTAGLIWAERPQMVGNREYVLRQLFQHFGSDERVVALARKEFVRHEGDVGAVLAAYGDREDFRQAAIRTLTPLPVELRSEIVSFLDTAALSDPECLTILKQFDLESDPILKTRGTLAYTTAVMKSQRPPDEVVEYLSRSLTAGGPDYESRRQSAVCGLDAAGRLELVAAIRKDRKDTLPINVRASADVNGAFVEYMLANWSRWASSLGADFERIFFGERGPSDLYWWSQVAPFVDVNDEIKNRLLDILSNTYGEQLHSELLLFLARVRPHSKILLDKCLEVVMNQGRSTGRWIENDVAAYILGRDFAGDQSVLEAILTKWTNRRWIPDNIVWACCEGWPDNEVVAIAFEQMKKADRLRGPIQVRRLLEMQILCTKGTAEEVNDSLLEFVTRRRTDMIHLAPSLLRPIVRRVRRDESLRALMRNELSSNGDASIGCSLAGVLFRTEGLGQNLRLWCLQRAVQSRDSALHSPVGFDLCSGRFRTSWEVAVEVLNSANAASGLPA